MPYPDRPARNRLIKAVFASGLMLLCSACSEIMEERYANMAEAERAGAIERGWVPRFVPASARNIRDVHDLDTNAQDLTFTIPREDIPAMTAGLPKVSTEDRENIPELVRRFDLDAGSEAFVICTDPDNAVLLATPQGQVAINRPARWADDDCS